ncbi:MAG: TIGR00159 family protein [Acidobacteria bacterium]|nr:MAG: TIGR00159 family protein [Acidobacteriota bacterium]
MDFLPIDLEQLRRLLTWRNVLDVALVTAVFYNLLILLRGTRAMQLLFGVLVLVGAYYGAIGLRLTALETTIEKSFIVLPFVIVLLFQQEIRRALSSFWRTPFFSRGTSPSLEPMINDVALAAVTLAERKIGALIVFERHDGLRDYIENGIQLDARVSLDLLINLFAPDTPTHDGAVIISGERIAAATCFLPLTQNPQLSKSLGTRHRAALGITEETDAVSVVVSEETGIISAAIEGRLERELDSNGLRNLLFALLAGELSKAVER